jgi:hypothetical protein
MALGNEGEAMRRQAFGTLVLVVATGALQLVQGSDSPPRLWILPFEQLGTDSSLEYLEEALPALLAVAATGSGGNHSVVERQRLHDVLAEQSLSLEGLMSSETRHRVGRLLGATVMLSGSYVRHGEQLLMTMRASDLEHGVVTAAVEGRGTMSQLGELVGTLYGQLAAAVGRRLPDLATALIDDAPVSNLHFMKGLGHYHGARYSQAIAEFALAGEDPRLIGISRFWLANAYLAQERYAHACLELHLLTGSPPQGVPPGELAVRLRSCERHLSAGDLRGIRELARARALK